MPVRGITIRAMTPPSDSAVKHHVRQLRLFAWLIIALLVAWQFKVSVKNAWITGDSREKISDFTAFYAAGDLALKGKDIYDFRNSGISRRPYLYPPTFAIFPMLPLALLPQNAALVVFTLINFALVFGTLWLLKDALWRFRGDSDPPIASAPAGTPDRKSVV